MYAKWRNTMHKNMCVSYLSFSNSDFPLGECTYHELRGYKRVTNDAFCSCENTSRSSGRSWKWASANVCSTRMHITSAHQRAIISLCRCFDEELSYDKKMSSEKFENLEDDLSTTLDKLRPNVDTISNKTGGMSRFLFILSPFRFWECDLSRGVSTRHKIRSIH